MQKHLETRHIKNWVDSLKYTVCLTVDRNALQPAQNKKDCDDDDYEDDDIFVLILNQVDKLQHKLQV